MAMTVAMAFGSCSNEAVLPNGEIPTGEQQLRLSVSVPESAIQTAKTRASVAPEPGEDKASILYLLFFAPDGGQYADYVEVQDLPAGSGNVPLDTSASLINVGDAYDILAVGNLDGYITGDVATWMGQWSGRTLDEVKAEARGWITGGTDDGGAIAPDALLMSGETSKASGEFDITVALTRNVIRFDIYNDQVEDYDLVSAEVWNAYPATSLWGISEDFSAGTARVERFYGVAADSATPDVMVGGLYCFENQSIAPVQNDRVTTAIIVELKNSTTSEVTYHRMNISPTESAQVLKENNVYRLTIRSVGEGSSTARQAYEAAEPGLDYVINYWDMTEYGLILNDGNSILSIPTKTITISEDGETLQYQIFTFNNSGSSSELTLKNEEYTSAAGTIDASLNGNTLTVTATALDPLEDVRTGSITVSYAGLEGTINVVQNRGDGSFLTLYKPAEGIGTMAPYAGIATGDIRVEASGPWTAELFMPDDGFTFDPATVDAIATTMIKRDNALVTDGSTFKIYTHSANPAPSKRDGFLLVTLDSDPENYAAVLMVAQAPTGGISIAPSKESVIFNGMGTGLAAISGNTTATFNVLPSMESDGGEGEQIAEWDYQILGDDAGMFSATSPAHSQTDPEANSVTVAAVGPNYSGRTYTATLRIFLDLDHNTFTEVTLTQQSLGISLSPGLVPAVATGGGETGLISVVVADPDLKWTANFTNNSGTSPDGRSLVQHAAKLVDQNGVEIVPGQEYDLDTKMKVVFPKTYYPNRDIPISATITATVEGMTSTITVEQTKLTARKMVGYGMTGYPEYGALGDTYNRGWDGTSGSYGLAQIPGYQRLGSGPTTVTSIPASTNYLHTAIHVGGTAGDNYNWTTINDFIDNRDGWTVLVAQDNYGRGPMNNVNSPTKKAGYNDIVYSAGGGWGRMHPQSGDPSKVYEYVMDRGFTPLTPSNITEDFYIDGVENAMPAPWPASATVLLTRVTNDNNAMLIIDVQNRFLWIGESQLFWYDYYLTEGRGTLLRNIMCFMANASWYGSAFTDLLLEEDMDGAQAAPWDTTYWGANAEEKAIF
jgi:hypothetical protein